MIFDFGCRETLGFFDYVAPALPGALAVLAVIAGLAVTGRFFTRGSTFHAGDILSGWGVVAGIMTLAAVFFVQPLLFTASGILVLMLVGLVFAAKDRYFVAPFWILVLFPGLFVLTATNAVGLGASAYDDFSHWVPNALYVFQHDDVPSFAVRSSHSLWPGYPYALPFLTYLASLLVGGFLVQGGAMFNFLLLFVFAAMLSETTITRDTTLVLMRPLSWRSLGLRSFALLLATFLNTSLYTPVGLGITNQGDTATMVLCGALGILFWRLMEALRLNDKPAVKQLSLHMALTAVAFVLTRQANIFLFFVMTAAFLMLVWRNGIIKPAFTKLPLIFIPAFALHLVWHFYVDAEIAGNGFAVSSLENWRFDLFLPLMRGLWLETAWKGAFFILFLATTLCGVASFFRPPTPWRNFAIFAALVGVGYAAFLILAYLGSGFTEYEIRLGSSFHRYMLHTAFLSLATLWFAAPAFWGYAKTKVGIPAFLAARHVQVGATLLSLLIVPLVLSVKTDWIAMKPNPGMCQVRKVGHAIAAALPDKAQLGVIASGNNGLVAFIVAFELALEEARTGRLMTMAWHCDSYHTFFACRSSDITRWLQVHPETNALAYGEGDDDMLKNMGFNDVFGAGFLVRDEKGWKSALPYVP